MIVLGKVVEKSENGIIKTEILRQSACGGKCGSCGNSCGSKSYVMVKNDDNANVGDVVIIESSGKKVMVLSFSVFIVPLISIFILYKLFQNVISNENLTALLSFFGGVLIFIGVVLAFRKLKMPHSKLYYCKSTDTYIDNLKTLGGKEWWNLCLKI